MSPASGSGRWRKRSAAGPAKDPALTLAPAPLKRRGGDAVRDGREGRGDSTGPPVPAPSTRLHLPGKHSNFNRETTSRAKLSLRNGRLFPRVSVFYTECALCGTGSHPVRASLRCPQQPSERCVSHLTSVPNVSSGPTKVNGGQGCKRLLGTWRQRGGRQWVLAPHPPHLAPGVPCKCRWPGRGTFSLTSLWDTLTPPQGDREFRVTVTNNAQMERWQEFFTLVLGKCFPKERLGRAPPRRRLPRTHSAH